MPPKRRAAPSKASKAKKPKTAEPPPKENKAGVADDRQMLEKERQKRLAGLESLLKRLSRTLSTQFTNLVKKLPEGLDSITVGELLEKYNGDLRLFEGNSLSGPLLPDIRRLFWDGTSWWDNRQRESESGLSVAQGNPSSLMEYSPIFLGMEMELNLIELNR